MKKINMKILFIIVMCIFAIFNCNNYTFATTVKEQIDKADKTLEEAKNDSGLFKINNKPIDDASNIMYSVITGVGILIAVIGGGRIAIGYIMTEAEGKADYKGKLIPYVIGMGVLFGSFSIWKIVIGMLSKLN